MANEPKYPGFGLGQIAPSLTPSDVQFLQQALGVPPPVTAIPQETPQEKLRREMDYQLRGANAPPLFRHQQIPVPVNVPNPNINPGFGIPQIPQAPAQLPPTQFFGAPAAPAAPAPLSFTGPFLSAPKSQVEIPQVPGTKGITAAIAGAKPKKPAEVSTLGEVFKALGSAGIDPNSPLGFGILRLGLAGLGGLGEAKTRTKEVQNQFAKDLRNYELQKAQAQQALMQQEFQNKLAATGLLGDKESAAWANKIAEQAQLTPSVKGGYILQPELLKGGKKLKTTLTPLPAKPSEKGSATQMLQELITQQGLSDPSVLYDEFAQANPQAAGELIQTLELSPTALTGELTAMDKAKIMNYVIQQTNGGILQELLPSIQRRAAIQSLGKRPLQ